MPLSLGKQLSIRSMVYVAGETIPFFWPMRSFIHHNPLHGLEKYTFEAALPKAQKLFHANTSLPRVEYQRYLQEGRIKPSYLDDLIKAFADKNSHPGLDLNVCFKKILTEEKQRYKTDDFFLDPKLVFACLNNQFPATHSPVSRDDIRGYLKQVLPENQPVYETYDLLHGTDHTKEIDELVIKACLDFYDEGQSVWTMPGREHGFFKAWSDLASRNKWFSRFAKTVHKLTHAAPTPESAVFYVMSKIGVDEDQWIEYLSRELTRLHGWVGYIRWRANTSHYYWSEQFPGDLVEYLAVRMTIAAAIMMDRNKNKRVYRIQDINELIEQDTFRTFLRYELHSKKVFPSFVQQVEEHISHPDDEKVQAFCQVYLSEKQQYEAARFANRLQKLASTSEDTKVASLQEEQVEHLIAAIQQLAQHEEMIWLKSLEAHSTDYLLDNISFKEKQTEEHRPFAQALFCIDTRSERIRRHLESVGNYETYGIAGFFGVPFSFMELGKGSESPLCPILLTPKNLVLEVTSEELHLDEAFVNVLEKAMHDLKETVLSPFVTVEAVGLLFGFDMVGKTVLPKKYYGWRKHLHHAKPDTHVLFDKLSRDQANSIIRTVQRALIEHAIARELNVSMERITDDGVRDIRECALEKTINYDTITKELNCSEADAMQFIRVLQKKYRINKDHSQMQFESLGRIGFSFDEQVGFVSQALKMIGMTGPFSRFVLLVGHGSQSENNPYESALDCGACGGNHGLFNARVLAQMANKPGVRKKLIQMGFKLADDVCFVPALHNTTTDEITIHDTHLMPSSHIIYLERLRSGLKSASMLCAQERLPELQKQTLAQDPATSYQSIQRNAMDWSQVRPEWGLSKNAYFIIGKRDLTEQTNLAGRSFLHSYDYKVDHKYRLLENILGGPLVVGQWINMEHYFSTVDNEKFGSGSKVYHNVAGRFGVMTGNLSDIRTGLPSQTVLQNGSPYHEPVRLITVIQAPFKGAWKAVLSVASVKRLVVNGWIRLLIIDPESQRIHRLEDKHWIVTDFNGDLKENQQLELKVS